MLCFEIATNLPESSLLNQPQCSQTLWESLADKPFQTVIIQALPEISVCSTVSFAAPCDQTGVSISCFLIDGNQKLCLHHSSFRLSWYLFSQGWNSLAHAQNTSVSRLFFQTFVFFSALALILPQRQSKIQTNCLLHGDTDSVKWLQPHFQPQATLQALSELYCTAVHTCKVVCSSRRCMCSCGCPPVVLCCQLRLRKEKPLVTLQ